jgi:hypothetical protein
MNLQEFLNFISLPCESYGDFRLVAGKWPVEDKLEPAFENAMVDVYADDVAADMILLLAGLPGGSQPKATPLTLKELEQRLVSLSEGRLEYSVKCSHCKPDPDAWRYDLPVCGSAEMKRNVCMLSAGSSIERPTAGCSGSWHKAATPVEPHGGAQIE